MNDTLLPVSLPGVALLAVASAVAGAVNSVAGGGTILTFPVLAAILPPDPGRMVVANATSTIGLWPASAVAAWAYRGERTHQPAWVRWMILPSVAGAIVGTLLVLRLPPAWFEAAVPWLILTAAILFSVQPRVGRSLPEASSLRDGQPVAEQRAYTTQRLLPACLLQFAVAIYGGYFGAGIGILMLAVLGLLGLGDIHKLNGVKNVLGTVINGVAAATFAAGSLAGAHDVSWPLAAVMAVAAMAGSLSGSMIARRLPAAAVRRFVAILGFALAAYYLWRHVS
ncbi:MAG: sulfite exporter TauE/SafE family protein [Planctomycetaceae bacterium]